MRRSSTFFLQGIIVALGIGTLFLLLWEPQLEGVNQVASLFQIYFQDPFLAYLYVGSISFFVALVQAFKVLGYAGKNKIFSKEAVKCLRNIKYCALTIIGFVIGAEIFIMFQVSDDRAGGVAMGVFIIFGSCVVATASAMFERILQSALDMKSENDLTV